MSGICNEPLVGTGGCGRDPRCGPFVCNHCFSDALAAWNPTNATPDQFFGVDRSSQAPNVFTRPAYEEVDFVQALYDVGTEDY